MKYSLCVNYQRLCKQYWKNDSCSDQV